MTKRLVQYGRARAQTLGWPDNYTFTKAMGERAVEELAAAHGVPLSIVRPSIIESSYEHPFPGWIEGFKMAEPIILAYGRGTIPDFPGIPEGIIDIIPADFVVNAMLAAAANPPEPTSPAYYHVSSGSRNPLQYKGLYEYVKEYFERDPLRSRGAAPSRSPSGRSPATCASNASCGPPNAPSTWPTRSSPTCPSPSACATSSRASTATRAAWTSCAGTRTCTGRTPRPR